MGAAGGSSAGGGRVCGAETAATGGGGHPGAVQTPVQPCAAGAGAVAVPFLAGNSFLAAGESCPDHGQGRSRPHPLCCGDIWIFTHTHTHTHTHMHVHMNSWTLSAVDPKAHTHMPCPVFPPLPGVSWCGFFFLLAVACCRFLLSVVCSAQVMSE